MSFQPRQTWSIIASFDGAVRSIANVQGDMVSNSTVALRITDRTNLYVEIYVGEADIARASVGNPASVTVYGLPGVLLSSCVTLINAVTNLNIQTLAPYAILDLLVSSCH